MSDPMDVDMAGTLAQPTGQTGTVSRSSAIKRLLHNPIAVFAGIVLVALLIVAVLANLIAPFGANSANIGKTLAPPDGTNWLGTDSAGRDIFSRLVYGARTTLLSAALCVIVSVGIGLPAGLIAGYYAKFFDTVANWVVNVLMSLPAIIVLLAIRASYGPSVWTAMIALGVLIAPGYFRLTRAAVVSVRNELYVDAARVSGLSDWRIIVRHIFSVVRAPIIIQTALVCGVAITIQSGLEFLGVGDPTVATWGVMLADGFRTVYLTPLNVLWPALAIGVTIVAFALLGSALRDALEDEVKVKAPRQRKDKSGVPAPKKTRGRQQPVPVETGTEHHLLKVTNLGVGYPQADGTTKTVVDDVSFHIDRGEVLGIVGESGSGKSQTAFTVLGLLPKHARITGGTVQFDGSYLVAPGDDQVDDARVSQVRGRRISYIPQEPMSNLDPAFTIGSQLIRPMTKLLKISKSEARKRAVQLLTDVGIADPERTMRAYPHMVSGGMAQRVLIAGAISCEPDLIIADEPTTALDVTVQAEVLDLLRDLQRRLNLGVVIVTHNFGVVADLCDRVAVMQNGRLVEEGDVRSILLHPTHPYTQSLLDSMLEGKPPMTKLVQPAGRQP